MRAQPPPTLSPHALTASSPLARQQGWTGTFAVDSAALHALRAGDCALLNGKPLQGLRHYAHAHVFGFLPCLLVGLGGIVGEHGAAESCV